MQNTSTAKDELELKSGFKKLNIYLNLTCNLLHFKGAFQLTSQTPEVL